MVTTPHCLRRIERTGKMIHIYIYIYRERGRERERRSLPTVFEARLPKPSRGLAMKSLSPSK